MKFLTWNINGIKSSLKSGLVDLILSLNPDVVCLQEIKSSNVMIKGLDEYSQYFFSSQKPGYSGVGILSKDTPLSVQYGFGIEDFDCEGRCITAEYDSFFLVSVYFPSLSSGRDAFRNNWDDVFYAFISNLMETKAVIICGDMNTAYLDIDVYSADAFLGSPGFTMSERQNFDRLLQVGLIDSFRYIHPFQEGAFTWWSYKDQCRARNIGMRLDYCLISSSLISMLSSCSILSDIGGSDHCPILLTLVRDSTADDGTLSESLVQVYSSNLSTEMDNTVITDTKTNESTLSSPIITQNIATGLQFKRYDYSFADKTGRRITRSFVILEREDGMFWFTNYHRYIRSAKKVTHNISQHGVTRFDFIIPLLNYIFFRCGIRSLEDITVDSIRQYLTLYATGQIGNDKKVPQRETVDRCIQYVFDFIDIALADKNSHFSFSSNDLYRDVIKRDKRGRVYTEKVPFFEVPFAPTPKIPLNRDIPEKAFIMLIDHIVRYHTDLLGLVILGAFAGTRPGEETNVRCENSPLGPGFIFTIINGVVVKIAIDLTMERPLRSDNVIVGSIKKERIQHVPSLFIQPFMTCYRIYEDYMATNKKREPDYLPFSVNRSGKAMTYDAYRKRFEKIVQEMIPIYLNTDDPELVIYGRILMERPISPHIFRHFYTVQLVLSGVSDVGELMSMRGDSSPESALTYLQNKGELEKQYSLVNNHTFDFLKF